MGTICNPRPRVCLPHCSIAVCFAECRDDTSSTTHVVCTCKLQTPALFDKEEVRERLRRLAGGPTQPLTVHLRQEIDRLNIVIKLTTTTLQNLRLAIAGTIALSGNLIEALDALFMARIPVAWLKKSWEVSCSPGGHYNPKQHSDVARHMQSCC